MEWLINVLKKWLINTGGVPALCPTIPSFDIGVW